MGSRSAQRRPSAQPASDQPVGQNRPAAFRLVFASRSKRWPTGNGIRRYWRGRESTYFRICVLGGWQVRTGKLDLLDVPVPAGSSERAERAPPLLCLWRSSAGVAISCWPGKSKGPRLFHLVVDRLGPGLEPSVLRDRQRIPARLHSALK